MKFITLHYLSQDGGKGYELFINPSLVAYFQNECDPILAIRSNYTKIWFDPRFSIDVYETIEEINEQISKEQMWVIPNG